jgi:hypothetical protein
MVRVDRTLGRRLRSRIMPLPHDAIDDWRHHSRRRPRSVPRFRRPGNRPGSWRPGVLFFRPQQVQAAKPSGGGERAILFGAYTDIPNPAPCRRWSTHQSPSHLAEG